ncbi:hypothetical protein [Gryllotalpicola ginsengisoli]|uniref:hypothetical protein n=1 Tax=Gryllotalpicola ginsengisoli TaxID=444608 RepID=UPI0003B63CE2|nr:hypothetical protein [Gryllotalpicola ginsengisoli]
MRSPAALADAAADYAAALTRLEDATRQASTAWASLPHALVAPGVDDAQHRWVVPAASLAEGLAGAAGRLHSTLLSAADELRWLQARASVESDDPTWSSRIDASLSGWAAAITAIRGGELDAGSLPRIDPPRAASGDTRAAAYKSTAVPAPVIPLEVPWGEIGAALGGVGETLGEVAGAVGAGAGATAAGIAGVIGTILVIPGSTDMSVVERRKKKRSGKQQAAQQDAEQEAQRKRDRINPYTNCDPLVNEGCQPFRSGKPGDEEYTGDKVKGDEPPGEMRGTKSDWTKELTKNKKGYIYKPPGATGEEGSVRVMDKTANPGRYPNGYVKFKNAKGEYIDIDGKPVKSNSPAAHIPRYPDGDFPLPTGWGQ